MTTRCVGQPLCSDCYDYASQVVWQWWAPELWRRFTITLRRVLAHHLGTTPGQLGEVASLQYAKVAEYQLRGAVHFHALVRLDGPQTPEGFAPAPAAVTAPVLAALVAQAANAVRVTAPPVHDDDPARVLAFGAQVDTRPVRTRRRTDDPDRSLTAEQVAGYLAKYATKSTGDTEAKDNPHLRRLEATARHLAGRAATVDEDGDAAVRAARQVGAHPRLPRPLRHQVPPLLGHPRASSAAPGSAPRPASPRPTATGTPIDLRQLEAELLADDEDETTVVIGSWRYVGSGWANDGETALAVAAAARAREYAQHRAEQKRMRKQ